LKLGILLNKIAGVSISPKLKETEPLNKSFVKISNFLLLVIVVICEFFFNFAKIVNPLVSLV